MCTFSCICAVNCEVSRLIGFQTSSLNTRADHFHFLRMTALAYQDLDGIDRNYPILKSHAKLVESEHLNARLATAFPQPVKTRP